MSPLDPSTLLLLATQDVTITYGEPGPSSAVTALTVLKIIGLSLLVLGLILQLAGAARRGIGGLLRLGAGAIGRVGLYVGRQVQDGLHLLGGMLTSAALAPMALANGLIGRRGNASHYGKALSAELLGCGTSLYRLALGNTAWFLGLQALTEGLERRLPEFVSTAPAAAGSASAAQPGPLGGPPAFEGYTVTGELEPGGSGARLYLAQPSEAVLARYRSSGLGEPDQVVLKAFDLSRGSTIPQIVRESRSLEAARKLGLVLDHHLDEVRFWYAMPYVQGEGLDLVTRRLHERAGAEGLDDLGLARVLGYTRDLLATLDRFHGAGLWHKDIKPGNLIVTDDQAQLVDLGLVTPLASAMTLTTHGTEYFRDPELVRKAISGARVQDVDGVKFDLYSVGAVVYSMVEGSFPAHGSLSRLGKRCPEALGFIIRRAMADHSQRYGSAAEMRRDVDALIRARDPWSLRPAQLPSMSGESLPQPTPTAAHTAALPPRSQGPGAAQVHTLLGLQSTPPDPPSRPRRSPLRWATSATLFLLMLAGVVVVAYTAHARAVDSGALEGLFEPAHTQGPLEPERPSAGAALEGLAGPSRILLLPSAGLDSLHPDLVTLRAVLVQRGHDLVGEDASPASIDLVARARAAAGLAELADDAAADRLQAFVAEVEEVDALVWLAPGDENSLGYRIFAGD